jgi:MtrB/PioB family decaheme-associated outer membrane protein
MTTANQFTTRTPTGLRVGLITLAFVACVTTAAAQEAQEASQEAQELTRPTSSVEVGPAAVSQGSFKAAEYSGLQTKGGYGFGDLNLRGGGAFDSGNALRWQLRGTDLGVEARNVSAEIGRQGKYRLTVGFDGLRRNRSDTFQTPYLGTGTTSLTLPGTWLVPTVAGSSGTTNATNVVSARGLNSSVGTSPYIDTATNSPTMGAMIAPTSAQAAQVLAAANSDVPLFRTLDLYTRRNRVDAIFNYSFNQQWGFDATFRPEHKDGVKPMGTVSRNTGADISTTIPDLIDADHDQITVALGYKGRKNFVQVNYYESYFKNHVASMSWQNWATPAGTLNTMSSAPSNRYGQASASAGFHVSSNTKIVATGSYGRSTQNDAFLTDVTTPVVPVSSLNGLVVTSAANVKLTARPIKALGLTGAYKYDNRDNRTSVNLYQYADAGEAPAANTNFPAGPKNPYGAVLAQNANANRPYDRRLNLATFDADYALAKRQWVKGGYDYENIHRNCTGTWINCADAAITAENTARAEWRLVAAENLSARVDYAYSRRRTPNYDENAFLALVPYANVSPASASDGATALSFMLANGWTGYGPTAGFTATTGSMNLFFPSNNALANATYANFNRISEIAGFRRYYVADRDRGKVRTLLTWQTSESLTVQGALDYSKDTYPGSTYGVQRANGLAFNGDASYSLGQELGVDVFYTFENQRSITAGNSYTANSNTSTITNGQPGVVGLSGNSCDGFSTLQQRNNNNKTDPCLNWSANMLDRVHTVGAGLSKKTERLDLIGNLTFSRAHWFNSVTGGSWANNILNGPGAAPTTIAAFFIPATPMPTVTTETAELRVTAKYPVHAGQFLRAAYQYLHMKSSDPAYEGMQVGTLSGVLGTSEQAFNYGVNVFALAYVLTF